VFAPYHRPIAAHLAKRQRSVIVAVHSFTPAFHGVVRAWHVGVLFEKSIAFANATIDRLRASDSSLKVGANVPYTVAPDTDFGVLVYGDDVGNPALEFEIRQDLIARPELQRSWARRLAETLALDVALAKVPV
jgi:predicted N-formylglutamate amidohydrolase